MKNPPLQFLLLGWFFNLSSVHVYVHPLPLRQHSCEHGSKNPLATAQQFDPVVLEAMDPDLAQQDCT